MISWSIDLPNSLKAFIDAQVIERGHCTPDECLIALIQADQDRPELRAMSLAGGMSPSTQPIDPSHLDELRARLQ